jgi:SAM-dependent methyltransferase
MTDPGMEELARAYEGLETPERFAGPAAIAEYRLAVLERNAPQTEFVVQRLPAEAAVLEVGCGNGRLLIDLARRGRCARGLGVDLARSRVAFAAEWAADERLDGLRFEAADALTSDLQDGAWDAALCVTGALAYFEPIAAGSAAALARRLRVALRPGGLLVLELYPHVAWRRMMEAAGTSRLQLWHELPEDDPWRYYLSDVDLDGSTLSHRKVFIHRSDGTVDEGRQERLWIYTPDDLQALLASAGFEGFEVFGDWAGRPYEDDELLVLTARACGG